MKQMNGKKRWLSLLLTVCMVLGLLPAAAVHSHAEACDPHNMEYWPEGSFDDLYHSLKCASCNKVEGELHSYDGIEDDDCNVCGHIVSCEGHSFEMGRYDRNDDTHVKKCDHCTRTDGSPREAHTDEDADGLCDVCRWHYVECTFGWTEESKIYGDMHYLFCVCGEAKWLVHLDEDSNNRCDVCTYCMDGGHTFTYDPKEDRDQSEHRTYCADCGFKSDWEAHSDTDSDHLCDVCAYCMGDIHSDPVWDQGEVDSDQHRMVCENCGISYWEDHDTDGENNACSVCGYLDTTVGIRLALRALDAETGTVIDGSEYAGMLDAVLDGEDGSWVENFGTLECDLDYTESYTLDFHVYSYCPEGYQLPENVTFTVDAEGSITITSDNAAVTVEEGVTYIIVRLQKVVHEHTYENDCYHVEGDKHYPRCDSCDYYDAENGETHYEEPLLTDHRCDGCGQYWRGFCTPIDEETDHYCVNGENCGARLTDLCTDEDENHVCDGCDEYMDWMCEDKNDDHLCDGKNCGIRLSDCADEGADGRCDVCGKGLASLTAQYTAIAYEAEGEDAFASGTLQVTASAAGTVTAAWGYGTPVTFTGKLKANAPADLFFEDVPLEKLDYVELTFTPDSEDVAAVTLDHYIDWDLVKLSVEALAGFDADTNGTPVAATFINGIPCMELYLFPETAVKVQTNLLPTDSLQVGKFKRENYRPVGIMEDTEGKFYYEDADGEIIYADAAIDSDDAISFTLPAEMGDRAWLNIFCTHGACVDSNQDHRCDSSICEDWMPGADANSDNLCDVCGQGMFLRSGGVEDCSLEQLLDSAADGDTIRLLADNNIAGGEYWIDAVWFNPEEDITVTLDLNGFDFSVTESKYLLGIGNGTLKIIDSSEGKTGSLSNPEGRGILELDGGVFDLSKYPDPSGITVFNGQDAPVAISGYTGDPTPIRLILPEGYGATIEMDNKTFCTNTIPADFTAIVVELPQLALDGGSKTLKNAHLVAEKVLLVGYLNGQLKAVQAVETVTPEITITDEVLAYVTEQGGEVKVFLLNGGYAPNYRVLGSE